MTLIKSISGIRGTIGGKVGESLSPLDIVRYTVGYANWIKTYNPSSKTVIVGRDARISGSMINGILCNTLISSGLDVIDIGLSTTPTVEVAVYSTSASGGIIITASHNPKNWNALKMLNSQGEVLSQEDNQKVLELSEDDAIVFESVDNIGNYKQDDSYNLKHINKVLNLDLVDVDLIRKSNFKVVLDAVNSTGGILIPQLLDKLGVECIKLFCDPNGEFPHNPEPLPENLEEISSKVVSEKADIGIVVDPDVDRLAFICEDGSMFGEEYTLVAIADYILSKNPGRNTVSNLSSTQALKDITIIHGGTYQASAVGEVNVVEKMKAINAIIGGEGNGGVIYPELHYGRDALVGIALFLTYLAEKKVSCKDLRMRFPNYFISKNKVELDSGVDFPNIIRRLKQKYNKYNISIIDGLKIDFDGGWIHLRESNTEPIIRIYAEANEMKIADGFIKDILKEINSLSK